MNTSSNLRICCNIFIKVTRERDCSIRLLRINIFLPFFPSYRWKDRRLEKLRSKERSHLNTMTTSFTSVLSAKLSFRPSKTKSQDRDAPRRIEPLRKIVTHGDVFVQRGSFFLSSFERRNFPWRELRWSLQRWRGLQKGGRNETDEQQRYKLYIAHKHSCRKRRHFDWRKRPIIYARTCLNCYKQARPTVLDEGPSFNEPPNIVDLIQQAVSRG